MSFDTYAILPTHVKSRRIQPGKRTILVCVLLSLMLLVAQLLRALQLDHPLKLTNVNLMQSISSLNEEVELPTCVKMHLGPEHNGIEGHHYYHSESSCQHLPSPRGLCSIVHKLFFTDKPPNCQHQHQVQFCSRKGDGVVCSSPQECTNLQHHYVGVFNEGKAVVQWTKIDKNKIANQVTEEIERKNHHGFVFIKCTNSSLIYDEDLLGQPQYDEDYNVHFNSESHVTNVAHDETDIRVQTLDSSLSSYLTFASKLKNTVTIIFSDHGSTYGKFIQASPEAHVEIFNPFLFMIFPKDVQERLGDVQMRILKDNENRLVTLVDLHGMLLQLMGEKERYDVDKNFINKFVIPGGLLSSISPSRTCDNLPLLQPNLCICKNFETSVEPNERHKVLSDFGLGVLNNLILKQRRQSGSKGFGNCKPIQIVKIRKVREVHISADLTQYKLDLVVRGAQIKEKDDVQEILFLTLEVGSTENALRLLSYERMNMYAVYANMCPNLHLLEVYLDTNNLSLSSEKYSRFLIHSGDVKMLLAGVVSNPKIEWQWKYNVKIT
ncbi:hypothetical protein Pmani_030154 [Petrolisthes manimaculis]|uniref:Uncharacterized protein n=1 Tax=Petrolisthes manimaculis TaxID=1843537 RepID=A0AAE1TTX1_9EUCA|nr:hypothetical protein Pmani_030154 [Petrolisthes manimaculis]